MAVIRDGGLVLVIDRSDGRGLSLPGGLAWPWESAEQALAREVLEETGLRLQRSTALFSYHASDELPCTITAFEVEAEGSLKGSWEGSPAWMTVENIRPALIKSQQRILDRLM